MSIGLPPAMKAILPVFDHSLLLPADSRCPLWGGGLKRSPQHFILEGKDGVWDGTEIS
jgi:hypothetical protein